MTKRIASFQEEGQPEIQFEQHGVRGQRITVTIGGHSVALLVADLADVVEIARCNQNKDALLSERTLRQPYGDNSNFTWAQAGNQCCVGGDHCVHKPRWRCLGGNDPLQ
jgi:hypothetical protein